MPRSDSFEITDCAFFIPFVILLAVLQISPNREVILFFFTNVRIITKKLYTHIISGDAQVSRQSYKVKVNRAHLISGIDFAEQTVRQKGTGFNLVYCTVMHPLCCLYRSSVMTTIKMVATPFWRNKATVYGFRDLYKSGIKFATLHISFPG